ncbi:thioredoxin family protein [Tenacibaculum sp. 190524A05c]|uniref:Thioredoxin domain-containing protein n=1 Tax=Tenacibaculum platacis TaxID=3137852 RepID=A0ABM9P3X1_9FLAO
MKKLIILMTIICAQLSFSQDNRGQNLIGKEFGDFVFEDINGINYNFKENKKTKIVVVSASWCGPCIYLKEAVNKNVEKYSNQIDFIYLFWDSKKELIKIKDQYNSKVILIPSKKRKDDIACIEIAEFENCFGFPTVYSINTENRIQKIEIGAAVEMKDVLVNGELYSMTEEEAHNQNYKKIERLIMQLIK